MTTLLIRDLTKVGQQLGSQQGGTYEHSDGTRYYVKLSKTQDHARNEILASRLYRLADVDTPELFEVIGSDGQLVGTASVWMDGAKADLYERMRDSAYIGQIRAGFAVDAWLANWDVAGLVFDNVVTVNGEPVRVDTGGCLLFRAMGEPKGRLFATEVTELDTLRSRYVNPQSFELFGTMSDDEIRESVKSLESVSPALIRETVESVGFDEVTAEYVIARLLNRREDILSRVA